MKVNSLPFGSQQTSDTRPVPLNRTPQPLKSDSSTQKAYAPVPETRPVVNGMGLGLEFTVDNATGTSIIRVYDLETGEVIRQIPPEEALSFLQQFEFRHGRLLSRWL